MQPAMPSPQQLQRIVLALLAISLVLQVLRLVLG
jgi:hypothetical protein